MVVLLHRRLKRSDRIKNKRKRQEGASPFAEQFERHEGEDQQAEHEEHEDVEDLRQSVPDASERSAELNTNKQS